MTTYLGTASGATPGLDGVSSGTGTPIRGIARGASNGIYGQTSDGSHGAVVGSNYAASGGYGFYGTASGSSGTAVFAHASGESGYGVNVISTFVAVSGDGVYGVVGSGVTYAGYFYDDVYVGGYLSKPGGGFRIDHPLDPTNKILSHSFVESPEMKNVYDGVGTADAVGEITVEMPSYFDTLNNDVRYQLTAIGAPAPELHIKQEMIQNRFIIAGALAGQRISWQITGNRRDPWAQANRTIVEQDKPANERGFYEQPEAYGQPNEKGVESVRFPKRSRPSPLPPPVPSPENPAKYPRNTPRAGERPFPAAGAA